MSLGQIKYHNLTYCLDGSCSPISYLWRQKTIGSVLWALHLGSAALKYPGSYYLEATTKGAQLAPLVVSQIDGDNSDQFALRDVTLGVETGGSPFRTGSQQKDGLLSSPNMGILSSYASGLTIDLPYIFLPSSTMDALATELPIYFDYSSQFYLWNADDPAYPNIVTSAAYVGFVFNDTAGANATMKVPMTLLNLTLESSISGLPPHVPCFSFMNITETETGSPSTELFIGKAFLQATFWGSNWLNDSNRNSVSWLAQAPGPGQASKGLGHEPTAISGWNTMLEINMGSNLTNHRLVTGSRFHF